MPNQEIIAPFTSGGSPALGLSPTIRVRDVSDGSLVVTDAAMTETGDGNYSYTFADYDPNKNYAVRCDGGGGLPNAERYTFGGNENYIDDVATVVSGISVNVDLSDLESDMSTVLTTVSGIDENVNALQTDMDVLVVDFARALGLMQENYFLDQTVYTIYQGVKLLTSGRIRIYSVAGSVGTGSNVTATYNITSNWTNDELDDYKVVKT